jgi:SM-20-related protein
MPSNYLNLKKIQETVVQNEYFPFFTVNNSFLEDVDSSQLVEDFPDISEGGSFPVDLNAGQNIKDLIKELEGPEFRKLLEDKFKVALRGYSRLRDGKIHTDSSTKTVTVLLYLNQNWNENEGHLRLLKDSKDLNNYIEEVPCTFGSMVGFRVTKNCWHGFQPYEGKRLSLQLNYISSQSLGLHNARHRISAFFKQFF